MTNSALKKEQQEEVKIVSGFVSLNTHQVLIAEQYKPKESALKEFIKKVSKKQTAIKISDIKITNIKSNYKIKIHKDEFDMFFDFRTIDKDVKSWADIQENIKQFLRSKVIELAYSFLRVQIKSLTSVEKGITKKAKSMVEAERQTEYDYQASGSLFEYMKEKGQLEEVKDLLKRKKFIHLKRSYVYVADALYNYIKLFRYSTAYPKHAEANLRNGKPIVDIGDFKSRTTNNTYETKIRIHDDWKGFCKQAGLTTKEQRHAIAKDLKEGGTIPATAISESKEKKLTLYLSDFISYRFITSKTKNSNLKNVTEKIEEIILTIDPMFLNSIMSIKAKGHRGYVFMPSPLQSILESVFQDTEKHTSLKEFCIQSGFKRTNGDKWSMGYRYLYEEIHAEVCQTKENFTLDGKACHLIVLNNAKLRKYAERVAPRTIKGEKFSRKEAIEKILTGLEVIRLATGDESKDYICILKVDYLDPAIHIYIKRMSLEKSQELEKLLLT
jgi:hypothetical protein